MSNDKSYIFLSYWQTLGPPAPQPEAEFRFATVVGRKFRFDWCFKEQRLAVEVDGGVWKAGGGRHGKDSDREKLNFAAALGWRVMRFSPAMINADPEGCIRQVVDALNWRQSHNPPSIS